jgi:CDP-diacylglycerol---glycerol-3-phosphate 3-phosphatidyltransferase
LKKYQDLRSDIKKHINKLLNLSVIPILAKLKISPNLITIIGLFFSIVTMILITQGYLLVSGIMVVISSLFDLLDGSLARYTKTTSILGGFFDAVIDRISEVIIYIGLLIYFKDNEYTVIIIFISALLNQLVSYIKAKYESYGVEGDVGIFTRSERIITLSAALILGSFDLFILYILLYLSIILSFITIIQRITFGLINTKNK